MRLPTRTARRRPLQLFLAFESQRRVHLPRAQLFALERRLMLVVGTSDGD